MTGNDMYACLVVKKHWRANHKTPRTDAGRRESAHGGAPQANANHELLQHFLIEQVASGNNQM